MPKAIVVGAGIGGLATAIRLAVAGFQVTVFESNNGPGGKVANLEKEGFRWDKGPSLFTLPYLLDELFELAGEQPADFYEYVQLPIITKYFFPDKTEFNAYQEIDDLKSEFQNKFNEPKENLDAFFGEVEENFNYAEPIFLQNPISEFYKNLKGPLWKDILRFSKMNSFTTMANANSQSFSNPKTAQIFNRYATYNGSNPYRAPATLNLIAHLEHNLGAFFLKGGMYTIVQVLEKLAKKLGVVFNYNHKVDTVLIVDGVATGVQYNGKQFKGDAVVLNADVNTAYRTILKNEKKPSLYLNREKSTSAMVFYLGMSKKFPELEVHNIFFSANYKSEFDALEQCLISNDPTVYVYISSKENKSDAPANGENWFVMINTPPVNGQDWDSEVKRLKPIILNKISQSLGQPITEHIKVSTTLTPQDIEQSTSSYKGSLYGNASNGLFSAFLRHPNSRSAFKKLYFVGGSVHPGGGIPLCLLSAKIAATAILNKS